MGALSSISSVRFRSYHILERPDFVLSYRPLLLFDFLLQRVKFRCREEFSQSHIQPVAELFDCDDRQVPAIAVHHAVNSGRRNTCQVCQFVRLNALLIANLPKPTYNCILYGHKISPQRHCKFYDAIAYTHLRNSAKFGIVNAAQMGRGVVMDARKDLLLKSAARLYSLGVDLEMAREKLRKLVEQGVSYESKEMKDAYKEFATLDEQWKALEKQHLELRNEIEQG